MGNFVRRVWDIFFILLSLLLLLTVAEDVDLSSLPVSRGFRILGAAAGDASGIWVSSAGDVNGDFVDDIVTGAYMASPPGGTNAGITYVIFGRSHATQTTNPFGDVQLLTTTLPANMGFRILGAATSDSSGTRVGRAGDVNGDGIDDIIVGAHSVDPASGTNAGAAYVIFGRNLSLAGTVAFGDIQLTAGATPLPANIGFRILGAQAGDGCGISVNSAGDMNHDGIGDIIVGASSADPLSGSNAGISYVIFGRDIPGGATAFGDIQLTTSAFNQAVGFRILGASADDVSGNSVGNAGDVNGDGINDLIIGAHLADSVNGVDTGITYVVFGRSLATQASNPFGDVQLPTTVMSANIGFRILGAAANDHSGFCASAAGDINGDNVDDVIIGALNAQPPSGVYAGISYVIFGRNLGEAGATPFGDIQLTTGATPMLYSIGFRILGAVTTDLNGFSVSRAGDLNGNGIGDIIMGAYQADPLNRLDAGSSYVIYGRNVPGGDASFVDIQLSANNMPNNIGYRIMGASAGDWSGTIVSCAGDVNNDGLSDVVVSSQIANPGGKPNAGITYVVFGVNLQPTSQPSSQPSRQPSMQPSAQPSKQPLGRPSSQPTWQPISIPSCQPSSQPTNQPSMQPSTQPSIQLSTQPTTQPSTQPTTQPTIPPSMQPSTQPSVQPSSQPSTQPSIQPSTQPSSQPSTQPTTQPTIPPSMQPSSQPSTQPTTQPTMQPSVQPYMQPSVQPTTQPSMQPLKQPSLQPSTQPSIQPSMQPSSQPSMQPTKQPSSQPSIQPSILPSAQPTIQPSVQPSMQPSVQPSLQPSMQPSTQPSVQPSMQPSVQQSMQPSTQPSMQPSMQPSTQPSMQPSMQPSTQPTLQSSNQPSIQPSMQPSTQPTLQPSIQPSVLPTTQPSTQPSGQPSSVPSTAPSLQPSTQPSIQPSTQPSTLPSTQPSTLPSTQPTMQPSISPTGQPLTSPSLIPSVSPTRRTGVWATILDNTVETNTLERIGSTIWLCGRRLTNSAESVCEHIESVYGTLLSTYMFPWSAITSVIATDSINNVVISGNIIRNNLVAAHIASCRISEVQLTCAAQMLADYSIAAGSEVASVQKIVYVGSYVEHPAITVFNPTANIISNYYYTSQRVKSITLIKALSPPAYIGSFVSGTCIGSSGSIFIFAGVVRSDSGSINAMYLSPASGTILTRVELVKAMALEYVNPDTFIAGGLQLSDGTGMHAYFVRVNSLYFSVLYGVRYRINTGGLSTRRALQEQPTTDSVVRSMVLVDTVLYMVVTIQSSFENITSVLKTDVTTGQIIKQVQLHSTSASLTCTNIATAGLHLIVSCPYRDNNMNNTAQVLLISMDYDLSMPRLPTGFRRYENNTFYAESILFHRTVIPMAMQKVDTLSTEYTFVTSAEASTITPSILPTARSSMPSSVAPSGQPSSNPSAVPSVSPQPTSQPSSSEPTNTYKPTVKPTQLPTVQPSPHVTTRPTSQPTYSPTLQPTKPPTVQPSTKPSCAPSRAPTRTPSVQPTRYPSIRNTNTPSILPTATSSVMPTAQNTIAKRQDQMHAITILGYVVAGLFGSWCLYQLNQLFKYLISIVRVDKILVAHMHRTDPSFQPRYPVLGTLLGSFCPEDFEDRVNQDTVQTNNTPSGGNSFKGQGAYMDGPASIVDLEANITNSSNNAPVDSNMSVSELSEYDSIVNDSQSDDAQLMHDEGTLSADESVNSADPSLEPESRSEDDSILSHEPAHSSDQSDMSAGTESYYDSDDSEVVFTISSGSQPVSDRTKDEESGEGSSTDGSVARTQESDASDDASSFA